MIMFVCKSQTKSFVPSSQDPVSGDAGPCPVVIGAIRLFCLIMTSEASVSQFGHPSMTTMTSAAIEINNTQEYKWTWH